MNIQLNKKPNDPKREPGILTNLANGEIRDNGSGPKPVFGFLNKILMILNNICLKDVSPPTRNKP